MTKNEARRQCEQEHALMALGFSQQEAEQLRRISRTLRRWAEYECNGDIKRDEEEKPYRSFCGLAFRVPDREAGALKRLKAILAKYPRYQCYHQRDPRGCALYLIRPGDGPEGKAVDGYYNQGMAIW